MNATRQLHNNYRFRTHRLRGLPHEVYTWCIRSHEASLASRQSCVPGIKYKALRSAGGFCRPLRSLRRKKQNKNANEADREVYDLRCTTDDLQMPRAPCYRITIRTPHACTKYIKDGERAVVLYLVEIGAKDKSFAHHTSAV